MKKQLRNIVFYTACLVGASLFAQNKNFLLEKKGFQHLQAETLYFSLFSQPFFKNNEYFIDHVSGYTLFGVQNWAGFIYRANTFLTLETGIFHRQDYGGQTQMPKIIPH